VHYSGSPLAIDFGEEANQPSVSLVELAARAAARVTAAPIPSAAPLRTVHGSLAELRTAAVDPQAWLRVFVKEPPRAGLKEEVQELLPRALEVRVDPAFLPQLATPSRPASTAARSPRELFADYLTARGADDPAVAGLFNELYEEVVSA
jgi:exonuclease SbcD